MRRFAFLRGTAFCLCVMTTAMAAAEAAHGRWYEASFLGFLTGILSTSVFRRHPSED